MKVQHWLASVAAAPAPAAADDRERAAAAIRDLIGVALIGSTSPAIAKVARHIRDVGGNGPALLLGLQGTTDPVSSALYNGSAAQAFDFDDIAPSCVSHVSAIMTPAFVALLDRMDPDAAINGYVTGLTVIDRLAEAFTHEVYDRGIQPTHTMGPIGAVTGLLAALGADERTAEAAFGLAATQLIGLRDHTGTSYKPVQTGMVAAAAVRAVLLATEGIEAGTSSIDVVMRLLGITDEQLQALARPGELQPVPLAPKWYPSCGAAHTAIESTIALRDRFAGGAGDAPADLVVTSPPSVMEALRYDDPANPDEARFSMHYCVAAAWRTGALTPADFSPEAIRRDDVRAQLARVRVVVDDALSPPPTWSGFPAIVKVDVDGQVDEERTERPRGYPERPLSDAELTSKFVACATPVLGAYQAERASERLSGAPAALSNLIEAVSL